MNIHFFLAHFVPTWQNKDVTNLHSNILLYVTAETERFMMISSTDSNMQHRAESTPFISSLRDCTHNLKTGRYPQFQKPELPFSEKQNQPQESTA